MSDIRSSMNNLNEIHPGKLKRKSKKSTAPSVVDLPAVNDHNSTGNLLGDVLFDSGDALPAASSLLDNIPQDPIPEEVSLKSPDSTPSQSSSPLDQLHVSIKNDADENTAPNDDSPRESIAQRESVASRESIAPHKLQKKQNKQKTPEPEPAPLDLDRLRELLAQSRDINQKCLDSLNQLQNTNIQNQKRYALNLCIAFTILAVLTVIGVIIGVNMRNDAKATDLKYKQETYANAIKAKTILEDEFEKEKRGSAAALEVYQKIEEGLFEESIEKYTQVIDLLTHPAERALLEAKIDDIRWKLAENAYHDGVMLYNASNYEQARDAFYKSLSYKENTAYAPRLNYYYAMSLYQLSDFEGARRYFSKINPSDLSPEMDAFTRYYRGICAENLGDETEAYEQFDQFLKKYRYHRLADEAEKHRAKVGSARK